MRQAHEESGAEIVTVAVRRVSLPGKGESILDFIDTKRFTLLPNTAGCYTADEAVRTAYLAREAGLGEMVKLEVIGDARTLFPDVQGLLEATQTLARGRGRRGGGGGGGGGRAGGGARRVRGGGGGDRKHPPRAAPPAGGGLACWPRRGPPPAPGRARPRAAPPPPGGGPAPAGGLPA